MSLIQDYPLPDMPDRIVFRVKAWTIKHSAALLALAGLAFIITVLWLPFGLRSADSWDGWMLLTRIDQGDSLLFTPHFPSRPFLSAPWVLAHVLTPGSYVGVNLILMTFMLAKGVLSYAILNRFLRQPVLAFLGAGLSLVYPADSGIFFLSALSVHFSQFLYLLSFYLLMIHWQIQRPWALYGSLLALIGTMGVYEAVFPSVFLFPLVMIWWQRGLKKPLRWVVFYWYVISGLWFMFSMIAMLGAGSGYHQEVLKVSHPLVQLIEGISYPYVQTLLQGFTDAVHLMSQIVEGKTPATFLLLAIGTGLTIGLIGRYLQRNQLHTAIPARIFRVLIGSGLVLILMGYAAYIPTQFQSTNLRTLYFSSWGAALVVIGGLGFLSELQRNARLTWLVPILTGLSVVGIGIRAEPLYLLLMVVLLVIALLPRDWMLTLSISILVSFGTLYLLDQHAHYDEAGRQQLAQLESIVRQAPQVKPGTLFLILDEASPLLHDTDPFSDRPEHFVFDYIFDSAIKYLYADPSLDGRLCQAYSYDVPAEDCQFGSLAVTPNTESVVWNPVDEVERYFYDRVIFFEVSADGRITLQSDVPSRYQGLIDEALYRPEDRIIRNSAFPPRALTLFY